MKTRFDIKSMALGVCLGAVAVFSIAAATREATPIWEYKCLYQLTAPSRNLIGAINEAANEGWEVVGYAVSENGESVLLKKAKK